MADYDLLQQAVANLVGNAFKYNRENGSVHVTLTAENGTAQLLVVNTGPGIPQEQHDKDLAEQKAKLTAEKEAATKELQAQIDAAKAESAKL